MQVVQLLKGDNGLDVKQKSMAARTLHVDDCNMEDYSLQEDDCNMEDYSSTTYLTDLNRHMQLVME